MCLRQGSQERKETKVGAEKQMLWQVAVRMSKYCRVPWISNDDGRGVQTHAPQHGAVVTVKGSLENILKLIL